MFETLESLESRRLLSVAASLAEDCQWVDDAAQDAVIEDLWIEDEEVWAGDEGLGSAVEDEVSDEQWWLYEGEEDWSWIEEDFVVEDWYPTDWSADDDQILFILERCDGKLMMRSLIDDADFVADTWYTDEDPFYDAAAEVVDETTDGTDGAAGSDEEEENSEDEGTEEQVLYGEADDLVKDAPEADLFASVLGRQQDLLGEEADLLA